MYKNMRMELEQKISKDKQTSMLRSVLKTPLVQIYQYSFRNGQKVNIKILCLKDIELNEMVGQFRCSWIKVEEVVDESSWLQYICIRQKLNQIGVAQAIDPEVLYGFDAIKCRSNQKTFGIQTTIIAQSIGSFIRQAKGRVEKGQIVTQFKRIMNDLQDLNITMCQNFDALSLRINNKIGIRKPAIRVSPEFQIHLMSLNEYAFFPEKVNPYQRDVRLIQQLIQMNFNQQPQTEPTALFSGDETNKIKKIMEYASFVSKTSNKKWHEQLYKFPIIRQNLSFLNQLYRHFRVAGINTDLSLLLDIRRGIITQSRQCKQNKNYLQEIHKLIQIEKSDDRKYDQTNIKINYDSFKKLYYNPLKKQPFSKSSPHHQLSQLQKQINTSCQLSKTNKCHYHFFKAKQAWLNLNLTRSIAHLQKAFRYASNPKLKSKIHIEMGFIWSQLCEFDRAEKQYMRSLQIIQAIQGEESLRLFSLLQNTIILYSKMEDHSKLPHFYKRLEVIKKRYNNMQFQLMPNLMHSFSSTVLFGAPKFADIPGTAPSKPIAKQDLLKIQIERAPNLDKLWQIIRLYLEKGEKELHRDIQRYEHLFEFGQLKMLYFIIVLVCNCQNDLNLSEMEEAALIQTIQKAKTSNVRMYFRLIFLLSYKYERQDNIPQAIKLTKILIDSKVFALAINNSLRKRILKLAKKGQIDADIKEIYADIDWLYNEGMIEELYNAIQYFQETRDYLACMKACKKYLQVIQDCQTSHDVFSKNGSKLINHTIQVQMILGDCMIEINLVSEAWDHLNTIPENKLDKNKICNLLAHFIIRAYEEHEYWLCINCYEKMFRLYTFKELQPYKMKDVWIATVESLVQCKYEYQSIENSLVYTYNNLPELQLLLAQTTIPFRLRQLESKNTLWQGFCLQFDSSACSLSTKSQDDPLKKVRGQIDIVCERYSVQRAKDIINLLSNTIQQLQQSQIHILIYYLADLITEMSLLRGCCSELVISLHVYLYQIVKSNGLHYEQVLIIFWFTTLFKRLQDEWKTELWGTQTKQHILDRLLLELFKKHPRKKQSMLEKLWWVSAKERDLLKLWTLYTNISANDEATQDDQFNFKILCGSYHLNQQSLLIKEVQKRFPTSSVDQL